MAEQPLTLPSGSDFHLEDFDPGYTGTYASKQEAKPQIRQNLERLTDLQEMLYAQDTRALLIVLQAMDTAGKDGTIKHVMGAFNPQGVQVWPFKVPSTEELAHDYLWRVHKVTPRRGLIGIFNRSHYEDVLVVRVKEFVPEVTWRKRYAHINDFERLLTDSGVTIVKFFLHISRAEQAARLRKRQMNPSKQWKFSPGDLDDRKLWDDYMRAYEEALTKCNTEHAPWYVIPANRKWYRNLAVAQVLVQTMERLDLRYPEPLPDIESYVIPE
ncbi:MAG: polyphosphate kinase 2 family protein [Anaerolineales bacterium]|jgi:PPK2 family polyphosphate:nucleotide phosphotransferase|nr:MAG: polyphosphate kinase 2 family protein [Anaerolineales bacterium]